MHNFACTCDLRIHNLSVKQCFAQAECLSSHNIWLTLGWFWSWNFKVYEIQQYLMRQSSLWYSSKVKVLVVLFHGITSPKCKEIWIFVPFIKATEKTEKFMFCFGLALDWTENTNFVCSYHQCFAFHIQMFHSRIDTLKDC